MQTNEGGNTGDTRPFVRRGGFFDEKNPAYNNDLFMEDKL